MFCPDGLWQLFVVLLTQGVAPILSPCSGLSSPGMYLHFHRGPRKYPVLAETSQSSFFSFERMKAFWRLLVVSLSVGGQQRGPALCLWFSLRVDKPGPGGGSSCLWAGLSLPCPRRGRHVVRS